MKDAKEARRMRIYCTGLMLYLVGTVCCILVSMAAGQGKNIPDATLTLTATSVRLGVGWTWGEGHLTLLDGTEYDFRISGLDVIAVGVRQAILLGEVYNLNAVQDFEGTYRQTGTGAAVGVGRTRQALRNAKGVTLRLRGAVTGVDFKAAISGMKIRFVAD
jgi:hypothetical protein